MMVRLGQYQIIFSSAFNRTEVSELMNHLKTAEKTATSFLGTKSPTEVRIVICPTTYDFCKLTGMPFWRAARTIDSTIFLQPLRTLENRGIAQTTITHEYVHLLLGRYRLPLWLKEGMAVYLSGEIKNLVKTAESKIASSPAAIEKLLRSSNPDSVAAGYLGAYKQTKKILDKSGRQGIIKLIKNEPSSIPR